MARLESRLAETREKLRSAEDAVDLARRNASEEAVQATAKLRSMQSHVEALEAELANAAQREAAANAKAESVGKKLDEVVRANGECMQARPPHCCRRRSV